MSRRRAEPGRRAHGGPHSTTCSEAPCRACRRPLLHAWDEGLLVKADAGTLDPAVADALRAAGRRIYARTEGGWLVYEPAERVGSLRLVRSRHVEHTCPAASTAPAPTYEKLELFDLESVRPPARRNGGMW